MFFLLAVPPNDPWWLCGRNSYPDYRSFRKWRIESDTAGVGRSRDIGGLCGRRGDTSGLVEVVATQMELAEVVGT